MPGLTEGREEAVLDQVERVHAVERARPPLPRAPRYVHGGQDATLGQAPPASRAALQSQSYPSSASHSCSSCLSFSSDMGFLSPDSLRTLAALTLIRVPTSGVAPSLGGLWHRQPRAL